MPVMVPTPYHLLVNTITLKREVEGVDAGNGPTSVYVSRGTYSAWVQMYVGNESINRNASIHQRTGTAYVAPGTPVEKTDRLVFDGVEYSIDSVRNTVEIGCLIRIDFSSIQPTFEA